MSVVAVVAWPADPLARAVADVLERRGRELAWLVPSTLAGQPVTLNEDRFLLGEREVSGILWRVQPDACFSDDFVEGDRLFADVETRALWLAALHSKSLKAPFRPEAAAFFTGAGWPIWRRRLDEDGIATSPLAYGVVADQGQWLAYHHAILRPRPSPRAAALLGAPITQREVATRVLLVGDELLRPERERPSSEPMARAAKSVAVALRSRGLSLAELSLDEQGALLTVDPFPSIRDRSVSEHAANVLAGVIG